MASGGVDPLRARTDDPWVAVSTLGEFAFCDRAGVIAAEKEPEDLGDEEPRASLRLFYRIPELEADIERRRRILLRYGIGYGLLYGVAVLTIPVIGPLLVLVSTVLALIAQGIVSKWKPDLGILHSYRQLKASRASLEYARSCIADVPPPEHTRPMPVNWWSLLQANYESTRPNEMLRDTDWRLCGKPWRILKYGNLRIPVFRKRYSGVDPAREKQIHHQHQMRITAYCRIVEATEGGISPYGIVMFGRTYAGVTVPVGQANADRLRQTLMHVRETLRNKADPEPPQRLGQCRNCPHGRPEAYHRHPRYMHSDCGDRFRWTPPHEKLDQIKARAAEHNNG